MLSGFFVDSEGLVISKARVIGDDFFLVEVLATYRGKVVHDSLNLKVAIKTELRANLLCFISRPHHPVLVFRLKRRLVVKEGMLIAGVSESFFIRSGGAEAHDAGSLHIGVEFLNLFEVALVQVGGKQGVLGLLTLVNAYEVDLPP